MSKRLLGLVLIVLAVLAAVAVHRRWFASGAGAAHAAPAPPGDPPSAALTPLSPRSKPAIEGPLRAPAAECLATLRGRVVDGDGRPVAGAHVESRYPLASATSDALGQFALELMLRQRAEAARVQLRASAPRRANRDWVAEVRPERTLDMGDVVLVPGGSIVGFVRDAEGRGIDHAEVRASTDTDARSAWRFHGPLESVAGATTDEKGLFLLDGLPLAPVRVWAGAPDCYWAASGVEFPGGRDSAPLVLRLERLVPEDLIDVTVVAPDGSPLAEAVVDHAVRAGDRQAHGSGAADELGRFRLVAALRGPHELRASDPHGRYRAARVEEVEPGTRDVVIALQEMRSFQLAVRDERGRPVPSFAVRVVELTEAQNLAVASVTAGPDADGRVQLELPVARFDVEFAADGLRSETFGPFEPDEVGRELALTARALPGVVGRVLFGGAPVPGARVELRRALPPAEAAAQSGRFASRSSETGSVALAGEGGLFALAPPASGEYFLRVDAAGFARTELGPLVFDVQRGLDDLGIALTRGGAIEGRVLVPAGESAAGRRVCARARDGSPLEALSDAGGRFRIEHVAAGPWLVGPVLDAAGGWGVATPLAVDVREGETSAVDVPCFAGEAARLRASLSFDGKAARGWHASLVALAPVPREVAGATLDGDGQCAVGALAPGEYSLQFHDEARGPQDMWIALPIALTGGPNERTLDLTLGRAQGRVVSVPPDGLRWRWQREDGVWASGAIEVAADLSFVVPRVPAGTLSFLRQTEAGEAPLARVDLPGRATIDVDL